MNKYIASALLIMLGLLMGVWSRSQTAPSLKVASWLPLDHPFQEMYRRIVVPIAGLFAVIVGVIVAFSN